MLLQGELSDRLPPIQEENLTGEAAVLKVFHLTGMRRAVVAGCRVKKGSLVRDDLYRVFRNDELIYEGKFIYSTLSKWGTLNYISGNPPGSKYCSS